MDSLPQNSSLPSAETPVAAESQVHWTDGITSNAVCANCKAPREGNFCKECGQRHFHERLKFWELVKDLFARLTDLEAGLFHTFLQLWKRPGGVARDYVSGRQKPYINPLTYFFLGAAAQILSFWTIMADFKTTFIANSNTETMPPDARTKLEGLLGAPYEEALAESYVSGILQGYSYAALFFFVVPFALFLWLFHNGLGTKFRMGESIVFSLFSYGHILIITAALTPFAFRIGTTAQTLMGVIAYIGFMQWAHTGFFQNTLAARVLTLLSTILAWMGLAIGIVLIFVISFGTKLAFAFASQS